MKSESRIPIDESPASTVALSVVRGILHTAETMGLPSASLCKAAGIDQAGMEAAGRITGAQFVALWEAATHFSNDPYCGLRIGSKTEPASAHLVGYLLMNCATVGQAIERYAHFQRIVSNLLEVRPNPSQGYLYLALQILDHTVRYSRQLVEWVIAGEAALLRELGQKPIKPVKVWFTHPAPADVEKYQRAFQSPVLFGQPVNALVLSALDLATPVRQPDPELFSILERQAQEYLKSLDRSARYVDRVRRVILSLMVDGQPGIDKVSAALKIGPRNLQLKLQAEGMSYQAVLEDVRKHLALRYLADDTVTVSEVSYLLGFSEPSVFHRAFRRWTGEPPGAYRKRASAENST